MKLSIELFISLFYIIRAVGCSQTFLYERMHNFGSGRRVIPRIKQFNGRYAYPEPLPSSSSAPLIHSPYRNLYQGSRITNDTRVYRRRFYYEPKSIGHRVMSEGLFDCTINHLAVETTDGVPIILRGGAGYRYFNVVVKAKPGDQLKGSVRAYCKYNNPT